MENFRIYTAIMHPAIIAATVSLIGIDIQTPFVLNIGERTASNGSSTSICLDSDRNMLIFALPML